MEDFLKDRPVVAPAETITVNLEPAAKPLAPAAVFSSMRADARPAAAASNALVAPAALADPRGQTGEHGTTVKTVVERGRVTKIIVTCACGKVIELACVY